MTATALLQFVGLLIPISLLSFRVINNTVESRTEEPRKTDGQLKRPLHLLVLAMMAFFVLAAWAAILQLVGLSTPYLLDIGYIFAGLGLTVPIVIVWKLRDDGIVEIF